MAERDDVGHAVTNYQVVNSRFLLPPDDDNGPDVHHQGHHRAGDVGVEVEDVLRLVYLFGLALSVVQCKLRTSKKNLNKVKIAQTELIPYLPHSLRSFQSSRGLENHSLFIERRVYEGARLT